MVLMDGPHMGFQGGLSLSTKVTVFLETCKRRLFAAFVSCVIVETSRMFVSFAALQAWVSVNTCNMKQMLEELSTDRVINVSSVVV